LPSGMPITLCVAGDDDIAAVLTTTVHGQNISGHAVEVRRVQDRASWHGCHLLYVAEVETRRSAGGLNEIKALPILTVSDVKDFSQVSGIVELYIEDGHMRFAINVDTAEHAGLHISSRLLGLARVVRSHRAP